MCLWEYMYKLVWVQISANEPASLEMLLQGLIPGTGDASLTRVIEGVQGKKRLILLSRTLTWFIFKMMECVGYHSSCEKESMS